MKNSMAAVAILALLLSGCTDGSVYIPPEYLTSETGGIIKNFNGAVADASTAKEFAKYKAWRTYYAEYRKAYEASGFNMSYQKVVLADGSVTYLPVVSYHESPRFAPPPDVSEHPVWKTAEGVLGTVARWGFGYLAVDSLVGGFKALGDNAGNHFSGPATISGSWNTAGRDQSVYNGPVTTLNASQEGRNHNLGGSGTGDAGLAACLDSPPGGYNENGTPMFSATESCQSALGGE